MKIAIFHNLPEGGAKIALYETLKLLSKKHKLHLFSFMGEKDEYDLSEFVEKTYLFPYEIVKTKQKGIHHFYQDLLSFTKLRKIHQEIAKKIDSEGFDLVYVYPSRLTQAPYLLRFLKTPSVYYCQEPLRIAYEYGLRLNDQLPSIKKLYELLNRSIRKRIDRENAISSSQIITSSYHMLEYITLAYAKHPIVCPLGVNTEKFKPEKNIKKKGILFIGKKSWIDGYDLLQSALDLLTASEKKDLKVIELSDVEEFRYSTEQMRQYYSQAQVTLCTAVLEPFGLVPLESMACETPVIAVKEGGYRETIIDGKTGFLIEREPKDLVEKIRMLINNPILIKKMGKEGREWTLNYWTWEKHVQKIEKILENIALHET